MRTIDLTSTMPAMDITVESTTDCQLDSIKNEYRFENLDGLRAIACFLVLIAHFGLSWESQIILFIRKILPGELGVMVFFCLSSFLITSLLMREFDKKRISITNFFLKRSLRIWPLYFFVIVISLLYSKYVWDQQCMTFSEYWRYLVFSANWHNLSKNFAILWSVCVEEQFYILLPLLLSYALQSYKRGIFIVMAGVLCGNAWRIFYMTHSNYFALQMYYLTPTYIDCFTYGGLAAWLYKNKINFIQFTKPKPFALLIILSLMLTCYTGRRLVWWEPYSYITLLSYGLMPIGICLLILHLAINRENLFVKINLSAIKPLGVLSFGVYLWHVFCLFYIIQPQVSKMHFSNIQQNEFFYILLFTEYCLLCVLLSALSFQFVELPFLKLRNNIFSKNVEMHETRWKLPIGRITAACSLAIICILFVFVNYGLF